MNINTQSMSANTLAITDYEVVNETLAKVVVAFTGQFNKDTLQDKLTAKMQYLAAPVENSFRKLTANTAIGFVRTNHEVRVIESQEELTASYKVMAKSNILMDKSDETLWRIKEGAAGKYLAREGNEDLGELLQAAVLRRTDTPKLHQVRAAQASPTEFVAFVADNGDTEYGFCVAANADKLKVVSAMTHKPVTLARDRVVASYEVTLPREAHTKITAAGITRQDLSQSIEYYTRLFGYAPEYLAQIIDDVNGTAAA